MSVTRWLRAGAFLLAGAALLLPLSGPALAEPATAGEMAEQCSAVLSSAKAAADPDALELDNTFAAGTCWGAFLAVQQFATLKISGSRRMMFRVCLPEDTKTIQLILVFDAYLRKHPERQEEPFTIVAMGSFYQAFPCR